MRLLTFAIVSLLISSASASNVIFVHPDGAGIAHWQAARMLFKGPDGELNWDRLPEVAVYRGHMSDNLTASSNGGATVHAYGVKVPRAAFGSDGASATPPVSAGGKSLSLMQEAMKAGIRVGVVNSGSVIEPGTAVFLASVEKRKEHEEITLQVLESGADVILSGGERWFLPVGVQGRFAEGARVDGRNLIAEARAQGYTVVFTAEELAKVPADTKKLLGVFAADHTFNDRSQPELKAAGLPHYNPEAPTLAEMTGKALEILGEDPFFLVVEEEGSDNFGNRNNAPGTFEALRRADEALGVTLDFVKSNPDTLLITAADSVAGGMGALGVPNALVPIARNGRDKNAAPYGLDTVNKPFLSAPDREGKQHFFVVTWGSLSDTSGGVVARAAGKNADQVRGNFDNTDVYRVMRKTLFGGKKKRAKARVKPSNPVPKKVRVSEPKPTEPQAGKPEPSQPKPTEPDHSKDGQ